MALNGQYRTLRFDSNNAIQKQIFPSESFSLSMGFLVDPDKPVIWRGPLVMSALQRLLKGAVWNPLDILIVDTPPGKLYFKKDSTKRIFVRMYVWKHIYQGRETFIFHLPRMYQ